MESETDRESPAASGSDLKIEVPNHISKLDSCGDPALATTYCTLMRGNTR